MPQFEERDNSGILFKNDKKATEKHPDLKGRCLINGQRYYVSAWTKPGKNGKFISLAFSLPMKQEQQPAAESTEPAAEDIPF